MYRLLQADRAKQQIPDALAAAPGELSAWCTSYVEELFIGNATRTARWISSLAPGENIEPADVEALGSIVGEALRAAIERHRQ